MNEKEIKIFQTSSDEDYENGIGRIWAGDVERLVKALEEEIQKLKDVTASFFIGEYKWMPVGSNMPSGWEKVEIENGNTLIASNVEGNTKGSVIKHNHMLWDKVDTCGAKYNDERAICNIEGFDVNGKKQWFYHKGDGQKEGALYTSIDGGEHNFAAGIHAELWQYKGK